MARPTTDEGSSAGRLRLEPGVRIGCVRSTYHDEVVGEMAVSAREVLGEAGLAPGDFVEVTVPGAFEIPLVAQRLALRDDLDAVLAFGLVLKGETEHDVHIARAVSSALMHIGLETETPVLFGVLTCSTLDQARRRAGRSERGGLDKGREVGLAAIGVLAALAVASGQEER